MPELDEVDRGRPAVQISSNLRADPLNSRRLRLRFAFIIVAAQFACTPD